MATDNAAERPTRPAQKAQSLLGGLVLGAEHMMALGCCGLLLVLVACGLIAWYSVSSWWSVPADPDQTVIQAQRGEIEHSSLDDCPAGRTKFFTQNGMVCR